MVSFWPFKTDDTASFEKTLSALSEKIKNTSIKQNTLRTRARRLKVLWTLYSVFAYILYSTILFLVTGYENWAVAEYAAVVGGPFIIYAVRTLLALYYDWRLSSTQAHLDDLQSQKDAAVEKFKAATKYNTTQQLLEKYGAVTPSPKSSPGGGKQKQGSSSGAKKASPQSGPGWTNVPPPPTANIQRPHGANSSPTTATAAQIPLPPSPQTAPSPLQQVQNLTPQDTGPTAEFAPNAYSNPPQYSTSNPSPGGSGEANWYDRILDALLGEDETRASNRIALICSSCRLVNGQAPPGVKTLEELGRWRCASCGAWNGVESDVEKIMSEATREAGAASSGDEEPVVKAEAEGESAVGRDEGDAVLVGKPESEGSDVDAPVTRARVRRVALDAE